MIDATGQQCSAIGVGWIFSVPTTSWSFELHMSALLITQKGSGIILDNSQDQVQQLTTW